MPVGTKRKNSKVSSNPFWYNIRTGEAIPSGTKLTPEQRKDYEYFDSVLEFKVYCALVKKYGYKSISRQVEIELLPKDDCFPDLSWKVDFRVVTPTQILLIEAKGEWLLHDNYALADFRKTLRLLRMKYPVLFQGLQLVGDKAWSLPGSQLKVIPFDEL